MFDIVGIGAVVFDIFVSTEKPIIIDEKTNAEAIRFFGGGPCATSLVTASKLGASCSYLGAVGEGEQGHFLIDDFKRYGVDTSNISVVNNADCMISIVLSEKETKTRTCIVQRNNLPKWSLTPNQKEEIKKAKIMLVDGNELDQAIEGVMIAKGNGVPVLYDAGSVYPGVERLLKLADILIPSETFALEYTKESNPEKAAVSLYQQFHPNTVVITLGADGGVCYDGRELRAFPSYPVKVVDTNGAGDVFHGAYAVARIQGLDAIQCCRFASAAAAIKCTKIGSRIAAPTKDELYRFIEERGIEI